MVLFYDNSGYLIKNKVIKFFLVKIFIGSLFSLWFPILKKTIKSLKIFLDLSPQ